MANSMMEEQFLKDAALDMAATDKELEEIASLANHQINLEATVKELESQLTEAKEKLREVSEGLLPEALANVGLCEVKLQNGRKISIKNDIFASIRKDELSQAVMWLDKNGLGDVVKDQVTVNFGRGESEQAARIMELCRDHGWNAQEKLSVHPQTLKALVKEQMERGIEFPEDYFSVHPFNRAIIK